MKGGDTLKKKLNSLKTDLNKANALRKKTMGSDVKDKLRTLAYYLL